MCMKTLLLEAIHYTFGSDGTIHLHETLKAIQDMTVFKEMQNQSGSFTISYSSYANKCKLTGLEPIAFKTYS